MENNQDTLVLAQDGSTSVAAETEVVDTVAVAVVPAEKKDKSKDSIHAIEITGIAMIAIFGFMFIFFLVIKGIDKLFPYKEKKEE